MPSRASCPSEVTHYKYIESKQNKRRVISWVHFSYDRMEIIDQKRLKPNRYSVLQKLLKKCLNYVQIKKNVVFV